MLGIMPRHACSARCGARRRFGTWRFRSAPCLPIWQVVNAQLCARSTSSHLRRTPTCGYVDNASALPTDPQDQKTTKVSVNLIALKAQHSDPVHHHPDRQAGQPRHPSPHSVSILAAIHRRTKRRIFTTNYGPKSPSRRAGDQSDEKLVIVRGALEYDRQAQVLRSGNNRP